MSDIKVEKAYERGFEFERNYHGCAQCVIGAIYEVFPEMRNEDVFRCANGLAAGTGLTTKGQCGALTGAVMLLSQIYGRELAAIADLERKRFIAYRLGERIVEKFIEQYGTVICGEIQKNLMGRSFYLLDPEHWDAFEKAGGHNNICPSVVGNATKWTAELILEKKEDK
ncbi:MAG: C-GCAxxG-C-C family protein [Desulfobacteraceae bacterium]